MKTFEIESIKGRRTIVKQCETLQDAITWAQNHCDLSLEPWTVAESKVQL